MLAVKMLFQVVVLTSTKKGKNCVEDVKNKTETKTKRWNQSIQIFKKMTNPAHQIKVKIYIASKKISFDIFFSLLLSINLINYYLNKFTEEIQLKRSITC